jgi:hypothetical protein
VGDHAYLPQKKVAKTLFAGGTDEDVERRTARRVHAFLEQVTVDVPVSGALLASN